MGDEGQDLREFIREQASESREFMREQLLISQRRSDQLHREIMADIREFGEAMRRHFDDQARKTDDLIAESRAQRAALFKMMDKLDNGGTAPAT